MEFIDTIRQVQSNWKPYKQWEAEQQKKDKQNATLRQTCPPSAEETSSAKQYGRTIVDVINIMDQHSIDKSEDAMVVVDSFMSSLSFVLMGIGYSVGSAIKKLPFIKNKKNIHQPLGLIGLMLGSIATTSVENIWGAQIQKQASRIARFQTRKDDLKDPRNFVKYSDEQLQKAADIAKEMPDIEDSKNSELQKSINPITNFMRAKKTTNALSKDYSTYKNWKKDYEKNEAQKLEDFKKINPTQEQIDKAEKDRDVMLGTIKNIENSSLNYLMDMSLALFFVKTAVLTVGTIFSAGVAGAITKMQKMQLLPKKSSNLNAVKIALPVFLPAALMFSLISAFAKAKKDAARVGRYRAKQDLLNNPDRFVVYSEQQRQGVNLKEDIKPKSRGFIRRFKDDISSLKQLNKDYGEYKNYMSTKHKDELKLHEALKQVDVTDEQMQDAVNLQKKAFRSFEKMDEKAQRFTDDTDAAVNTGRTMIVATISTVCRISAILLLGKKLAKFNNSEVPGFKKSMKLLEHLSGKEIALIMTTFLLPSFIKLPIVEKGIQIKKDAGKIGVMSAMNDLEDPKNFLD